MSAARRTIPGLRSTQEAPESGLLDDLTTDRRTRGTAPEPTKKAKPPKPAQQGKTVRMTLDLSADERQRLALWATRAGLDIGRPRLGSTAVLRAVIEALTDPERACDDVSAALIDVLRDREERGLNWGN